MRRRTFLGSVAAVAGSLSLAGCLGSGGLSRDDYDIGMASNAFLPAEYTVSVGDTIVWGNPNSRAHSVTAYENAIPKEAAYFASGGFDGEQAARDSWRTERGRAGGKIFTGETYEHTFETPGEYRYFCIPHEVGGMKGTIVVEE
jgi:plastocyanin